jgi:hypothetical protein
MTLVTGSKLGPYEIVAPLDAGGMGEVYRARDTRLNPITPGWSANLPLRRLRKDCPSSTPKFKIGDVPDDQ